MMTSYPLTPGREIQIPTRQAQPAWGKWGLRLAAATYLLAFVAVPVVVVNVEGLRSGFDLFWASLVRPAALNAIWLTLWTAALMTVINVIMGTLTAYVLVTYRFPGKEILNTL